ncbi:integrin-like protein [Candidatus Midichloria mitochondrii IricVA]|uniref:Integrin-like protein n=1 Tax=Midichloria mitochondrii (strain IricVA) TaxID=696127 RepID=F7XWV6_MIDMI|nr:integrin-like protein [Candidatus Midichloria mitochondrii IricVA]
MEMWGRPNMVVTTNIGIATVSILLGNISGTVQPSSSYQVKFVP